MPTSSPLLPWLEPGESFPSTSAAWGEDSPAPGLLAAGGDLQPATLLRAYSNGIFPWYSEGQPTLWWSTSPRMTLWVDEFRLHRSLKKTIRRFRDTRVLKYGWTALSKKSLKHAPRPLAMDKTAHGYCRKSGQHISACTMQGMHTALRLGKMVNWLAACTASVLVTPCLANPCLQGKPTHPSWLWPH